MLLKLGLILFFLGHSPVVQATSSTGGTALSRLLTNCASTIEQDLLVAREQRNDGSADFSFLKEDCEIQRIRLSVARSEIAALEGVDASRLELKCRRIEDRLEQLQALVEQHAPEGGLSLSDIFSKTKWTLPRPGRRSSSNDSCENAILVDYGDYGGELSSTAPDGAASCGDSPGSPDVWYRFTAYELGTSKIWLSTEGSSFDTTLSVHSACPGNVENELACNDDSMGLQSNLVFNAEFGHQYWIRISGSGEGLPYLLHVNHGIANWSGTVRRASTGADIATARINLYDLAGYYVGSDYSDEEGLWEFEMGEDSTVHAKASRSDGFVSQVWDHHDCLPECDLEQGDPLPIGNDSQGHVDFDLVTGGLISGRITDELTGDAIGGLTVHVSGLDDYWSRHIDTDSNGEYSFALSMPGRYCVYTSCSEYQDEVWDNVPCSENSGAYPECWCSDGTPITVGIDEEAPNIDFALQKMGRLTGTVRDSLSGEGIPGINVYAYDIEGNPKRYTETGSDGTWTLGGLSGDTYYLDAFSTWASLYSPQNYNGIDCLSSGCYPFILGTPVPLAEHGLVENIDFFLRPNGRIAGRVVDERSGDPLSGARIYFYNDTSRYPTSSTTTDTNGYYLSNIMYRNGNYHVTAERPGWSTQLYSNVDCPGGVCDLDAGTIVEVAQATTTGDIDFQLRELGVITGRVSAREDGSSLSGHVTAYDASGHSVAWDYVDGEGNYVIGNLEPGSYFLFCSASGGEHLGQLWNDIPCWEGVGDDIGQCNVLDGDPVAVDDYTQVENIDFTLDRGGTIRGTVVSEETGNGVHPGVVRVVSPSGETLRYDYLFYGAYELTNIPPGDWVVAVDTAIYADEAWKNHMCAGEFPSGCDLSSADPVHIEIGDLVDNIDFILEKRPVLSGRIVDSVFGTGVSNFQVDLYQNAYSYSYRTWTDTDGFFSFEGVNPGTYYLYAAANSYSSDYISQVWQGIDCPSGLSTGSDCTVTSGTPISIVQGQNPESVLFQLKRKGSISGAVSDIVTGWFLDNAFVEIWKDGARISYTYADENGRYKADRLVPGNYVAVASGPHYDRYMTQLYPDIPCDGGLPYGCNGGIGTPIQVSPGLDSPGIDFHLESTGEVLYGRVVDDLDGVGVPSFVSAKASWNTNTYEVSTDSSGWFRVKFSYSGDYVLWTSNSADYRDEVYDNIPCDGPVPFGTGFCDPALGTLVTISSDYPTMGVEFRLLPFWLPLFEDGFETGNLKGWSLWIPEP